MAVKIKEELRDRGKNRCSESLDVAFLCESDTFLVCHTLNLTFTE